MNESSTEVKVGDEMTWLMGLPVTVVEVMTSGPLPRARVRQPNGGSFDVFVTELSR